MGINDFCYFCKGHPEHVEQRAEREILRSDLKEENAAMLHQVREYRKALEEILKKGCCSDIGHLADRCPKAVAAEALAGKRIEPPAKCPETADGAHRFSDRIYDGKRHCLSCCENIPI